MLILPEILIATPGDAPLPGWGVRVVEPQDIGEGLMMAPTDLVLEKLG